MEINFVPTDKQAIAYRYAMDETTTEIGYGGAARGGKSWFSIIIPTLLCLANPGIRWGLARKELKNLKRTSLNTFFKICETYGLKSGEHYTFKQQDGIIKFHNGSEIILIDAAYSPSDPLFLRFGGLEMTGQTIEESNELHPMAVEILKSRVGNCLNEKYGIKAMTIETFNPDKGHVYRRYYKPWKEGKLPDYRVFIKALPTDNPHTPELYIKTLERSNKVTRERLLYGNFEYDDDPAILIDYESACDIFTNDFIGRNEKGEVESDQRFTTTDIAMQGRDLFVIINWNGLRGEVVEVLEKTDGKEIEDLIEKWTLKNKTPRSHELADSDGIGNYLSGYRKNMKTFHGGASASNKEEYRNLRSECYFKLAELINSKKIYISIRENIQIKFPTIKEDIIFELQQIRHENLDKDDQKNAIVGKDKMKLNLGGKSPDFSDTIMMRMFWVVNKRDFSVRAG